MPLGLNDSNSENSMFVTETDRQNHCAWENVQDGKPNGRYPKKNVYFFQKKQTYH